MTADGLYTVALGRMMPGGDVTDAAFAGQVGSRLGNLPGQVNIGARGNRGIEIALRAARAPGHAADLPIGVADHQWLAVQGAADLGSQTFQADGKRQGRDTDQIALRAAAANPFVDNPAKALAELDVIAELRVRVER